MNREADFIIAAVRKYLHPDDALPDIEGLKWSEVLRLATSHAVVPMVWNVVREPSAGIPASVAAEWSSYFTESVHWSLLLTSELITLTQMLQDYGIDTVALKGPLLSAYLYGMIGARSSGDIDLLVKRSDVLRVRDLLVSRGYRCTSTLHWNADSACLRSRENEISFESPSRVSIDVHWRMLPEYFASPFDDIDSWRNLKVMTLGGCNIQTLAPEHNLFLLCSHSSKHGFERLGWVCDIARFLMVTPELDWKLIRQIAQRTRTLRQVRVSLRLAEELLGASHHLQAELDQAERDLVSAVIDRLRAGAEPPTPHAVLFHYCLGLFETRRHRWRFIAGHLAPSEAEHAAVKLPPSLYFLYYPYRPMRLLTKRLGQVRGTS